nr:LPTK14=cytoplasmic tyrosine protein kinase/Src homolog [Hirudo medicinalis=leeches, Annelida, embryonic, Peptide, 56 aa] [Hirudo medicinalis]
RAANCLVNENYIAKVADFGLAKMVDEGIYEGGENCKFPVKWTAPEGLSSKTFTVKS